MRKLLTIFIVAVILAFSSAAFADKFWGAASPWSGPNPVLFTLDTTTGIVGTRHEYPAWHWIMAVTWAPGNILYVSHDTISDFSRYWIARVDASTGIVLSDTPIKSLTGTDYPQWNALEYYDGKIYGVENCVSSPVRGYVYEVALDANGDPTSATLGSYVGPAPDGALAYRDGTWYASEWASGPTSLILTTTDIMNTDFSGSVGTSPVAYISGWDFEADGGLLGVTWFFDFHVWDIDPLTGNALPLYDIQSQLPIHIGLLTAISAPPASYLASTSVECNLVDFALAKIPPGDGDGTVTDGEVGPGGWRFNSSGRSFVTFAHTLNDNGTATDPSDDFYEVVAGRSNIAGNAGIINDYPEILDLPQSDLEELIVFSGKRGEIVLTGDPDNDPPLFKLPGEGEGKVRITLVDPDGDGIFEGCAKSPLLKNFGFVVPEGGDFCQIEYFKAYAELDETGTVIFFEWTEISTFKNTVPGVN